MSTRTLLPNLLSVLGLTAFLMLTDCASGPKAPSEDKAGAHTEESSNLTREQAAARKARVDQVVYTLTTTLHDAETFFDGDIEIAFQLKDASSPLRLDFFEGRVSKLVVNGTEVPAKDALKKYWLDLPQAQLKEGTNVVRIVYSQDYSKQGQGLHKFTDPETKEVFLYSQFESFDANRFIPSFDQPDLRSVMKLTVNAPSTWQVITATRESSVKPLKTGWKTWTFPATMPISTYLFSLHAGPYKVWTDQYQGIPLRLYARPSLAKWVRAKEWFTISKQGLKFFEDYFAFKYPFKKYDQLIVPEFNGGAMENVGAVTFTEEFIRKGEPTRRQRRALANTILHEMAHMWFGDVVTMAWWNDLWLNESFADYMASLSTTEATEFKETWQAFYGGSKGWAYWEDNLVTTHPIEAPIKDVKEAETSFDGITYGKGASVIKQLNAHIGPENFKKGIRTYFKRHAYTNTTLTDFIAALQTETKHDLTAWAARWLKQSGTDKLAAHWKCDGDRLKQVEISSTPMKPAEFRPQTVKLALFGSKMTSPTVIRVPLTEARTQVAGDWACPAFVYPNYQDDAYARVSLDPVSLQFAKTNVYSIPDTLLRHMVWNDIWQMVRGTEMPLSEYIKVVDTNFAQEKNDILLQHIVDTVSGTRGEGSTVINYWPIVTEKGRTERMEFIAKIEAQYLKRFQAAVKGTDDQRFWFDAFVALARTPKGLEQVATWAKTKGKIDGMTVDIDRRWNLVRQLTRFGHKEANTIVAEVSKEDVSDRGRRQALSVEAIQANTDVKRKWVTTLKQPKPTVSIAEAWAVMGSLFPVEQRNLAREFYKDFYEYVNANAMSENEIFVQSVASTLMPLDCNKSDRQQLATFFTKGKAFTPGLSKKIKVGMQEDERCENIRAMSAL